MTHIENVVIGNPICYPMDLLAKDEHDWLDIEYNKTKWTEERFLPKILVDIGFAPSTSEVRRNRKDLVRNLDTLDFLQIKYGKKKCWILVGE
jgi:hypothetical protein